MLLLLRLLSEVKVHYFETLGHKKWASYSHHTATTNYPCCVPTLGDSSGAGCVRLAHCEVKACDCEIATYFVKFNHYVQLYLW